LRLDFTCGPDGQSAEAVFTPGPNHQGWAGLTHGGLVMTVLDEAMAKAAACKRLHVVTAEVTVRLKNPAHVGEPLHIRGIVKEIKKRIVYAEAAAARPDGTIIAEAAAKMFIIDT
jgi:acyl-coenzyme A thioesterase PaaI-like protein